MNLRTVREMRTVGECLDALLRGELPRLGDILMQRLKALEQSTKDGHWEVAENLDRSERVEVLTPLSETHWGTRWIRVQDPDGNLFCLESREP